MNAAQNAYDNRYDVSAEFPIPSDSDEFEKSEDNKTWLVETFVTYHNAVSFEGNMEWLAKQIGFDADYWATEFVADELEELLK